MDNPVVFSYIGISPQYYSEIMQLIHPREENFRTLEGNGIFP